MSTHGLLTKQVAFIQNELFCLVFIIGKVKGFNLEQIVFNLLHVSKKYWQLTFDC